MKLVPSNNFSKKLHYILKYFVLALPMLLLLISCLIPKKNINNNYSVDSTTTINYKYQTNEVNSADDLINGNIYLVSFQNNIGAIYSRFGYSYIDFIDGFVFDSVSTSSFGASDVPFIGFSGSNFTLCQFSNYDDSLKTIISGGYVNLVFVYRSSDIDYFGDVSFISACPQTLIPIDNTTITNTINENSSLISSNEVRRYNDEIISPIMTFYEMPLNNFYFDLLDTIGIVYTNEIVKYLLCYVLWIMYVYLFDLIADIFAFIPKILHNLAYKIGGED